MRKVRDTGMEMSFVSFGRLSQSDTVTKVDAAIGRMCTGDEKVEKPIPQLSTTQSACKPADVLCSFADKC